MELEQRKYINDYRYLVEQNYFCMEFCNGSQFQIIQKISTVKNNSEILNKRNISKKDSLKNKIKTINHLKRISF